jgi:hypothetical protein
VRAKEFIPKRSKSAWTTSLYDLQMTPQEKALRSKVTHDWIATKFVLAKARAREVRLLLRSLQQQLPLQPAYVGYGVSSLPKQQQAAAPMKKRDNVP